MVYYELFAKKRLAKNLAVYSGLAQKRPKRFTNTNIRFVNGFIFSPRSYNSSRHYKERF